MHPRPTLILALLLLPAVSASDAPTDAPDALAIGRITDTDHVQLAITLRGQHQYGDILPLCQDALAHAAGTYVIGIPDETCFLTLHIDATDQIAPPSFQFWSSAAVVAGSGPVCIPVGGSVLPEGGPPVVVRPDYGCLAAIVDEILG